MITNALLTLFAVVVFFILRRAWKEAASADRLEALKGRGREGR